MNSDEIYQTYNDLSENEAFEAFEVNDVSLQDIVHFLGYDVANEYTDWIRKNQK